MRNYRYSYQVPASVTWSDRNSVHRGHFHAEDMRLPVFLGLGMLFAAVILFACL